jgi:hypothetical protein
MITSGDGWFPKGSRKSISDKFNPWSSLHRSAPDHPIANRHLFRCSDHSAEWNDEKISNNVAPDKAGACFPAIPLVFRSPDSVCLTKTVFVGFFIPAISWSLESDDTYLIIVDVAFLSD